MVKDMRVIVINDYGSITGGAGQVAISSLNALAESGLDVTFLSGVLPIDKGINLEKVRAINFGLYDFLQCKNRVQASLDGIWNFYSARVFAKLLDEYNPSNTVIHIHGWLKSFSPSIMQQALRRRFRVVITLHDYFTICPNGGLYNYQTRKHCNLRPMSAGCLLENCDSRSYSHKLWRFSRQFIQNKFAYMPSGVKNFISVSSYSELFLKKYLPSNAKIFNIRNPVDVKQREFSWSRKSENFVFVGRLSPEKGGALFAGAATKAKVKAVFVGDGPEKTNILMLCPNAELRGWCNRSSVIENMYESRAIVFPSLLHETQGLVVAEAAALGVPAIVSDGCAAMDAIEDGVTGLLFKHGDINDLSLKLKLLNDNPRLAIEMGKNAYDRYWANSSTMENHVSSLVSCYKKLITESL